MRMILEENRVAEFCIWLTVKKGFLSIESIRIREVSKYLSLTHQLILYRMSLSTTVKWPKMVPFNQNLNY